MIYMNDEKTYFMYSIAISENVFLKEEDKLKSFVEKTNSRQLATYFSNGHIYIYFILRDENKSDDLQVYYNEIFGNEKDVELVNLKKHTMTTNDLIYLDRMLFNEARRYKISLISDEILSLILNKKEENFSTTIKSIENYINYNKNSSNSKLRSFG